MRIVSDLIDFFLVKSCPFCGEINNTNDICCSCYSNLEFLVLACRKCQQPMNVYSNDIAICAKCIGNNSFYNEMIGVFSYNNFLKKQIVNFKNNNFIYLSEIFAKMIYLKAKHLFKSNSIIVPVPLFRQRLVQRGYNQSSFIGRNLASIAGVQYIDDLIIRVKDTKTQAGKTAKERIENMEGAFIFNKKHNVKDQNIFILDDVITTGATIFECASVVYNEFPNEINLLCIGRTVI